MIGWRLLARISTALALSGFIIFLLCAAAVVIGGVILFFWLGD